MAKLVSFPKTKSCTTWKGSKIAGGSKRKPGKKFNRLLDNEMIVAYTTSGKGLTAKAYSDRLKKAAQQIKSGNFLSQEEAEKEAEDW